MRTRTEVVVHAGIDVAVCVADVSEPSPDCTHALDREVGNEFRVVRAPTVWEARQNALDSSSAFRIATPSSRSSTFESHGSTTA